MRSRKSRLVAGIGALLATGLASSARAADLSSQPNPPAIPVTPPQALDLGSGFYLRGDIGWSNYEHSAIDTVIANSAMTTTSRRVSNSGFFAVGAGYRFNNWLRADITGEYRLNASHRHSDSGTVSIVPGLPPVASANVFTGKIGGFVGLVNGYIDLGTWNRITPFVGAGVGLFSMTMSKSNESGGLTALPPSSATSASKTNIGLAWALHAGLSYDLGGNWTAELGYRYLHLGTMHGGDFACPGIQFACPYHVRIKNLASHDVKIGLRYLFSDATTAPDAVSGPLVRKH